MKEKLLVVEDHALVRESQLLLLAQRLPELRMREAGSPAQRLPVVGLAGHSSMRSEAVVPGAQRLRERRLAGSA